MIKTILVDDDSASKAFQGTVYLFRPVKWSERERVRCGRTVHRHPTGLECDGHSNGATYRNRAAETILSSDANFLF